MFHADFGLRQREDVIARMPAGMSRGYSHRQPVDRLGHRGDLFIGDLGRNHWNMDIVHASARAVASISAEDIWSSDSPSAGC